MDATAGGTQRDRPALIGKLREQVALLDGLGEMFDSETPAAALPIATSLRVLLHDTKHSHSILGQLHELKGTQFLDTSSPLDPRNLLSHSGLAVMNVSPNGGTFEAPLSSLSPSREPRLEYFDSWWSATVIRDVDGHAWTRRQIVLNLANKEGGAHLDPREPDEVRALERDNSMGWVHRADDAESPFRNGPLAPSVRQISFEVVETIRMRRDLL